MRSLLFWLLIRLKQLKINGLILPRLCAFVMSYKKMIIDEWIWSCINLLVINEKHLSMIQNEKVLAQFRCKQILTQWGPGFSSVTQK